MIYSCINLIRKGVKTMAMKIHIIMSGMVQEAENDINAWLEQQDGKIDVKYVTQSQGAKGPAGAKVWTSIWYTERGK